MKLICSRAVGIVLSIPRCKDAEMTTDDASAKAVRKYIIQEININAEFYQNMLNFDKIDVTEPPATERINNEAMQNFRTNKLVLDHPCLNQAVEGHVKLLTDASMHVAGFKRRDSMIQQKIKSRKLMTSFNTKKQFIC